MKTAPKHAYVSLLTTGGGYVPGVEALGASLSESGSTIPRILMVTPQVPAEARRRLASEGWEIREVELIANPNPERQLFARYASVFTKLRAWQQDDLDKLVFLDADIIVRKNADDLFTRPSIAAAPDFFQLDHFNSGVMVIEPSSSRFDEMMDALARAGSYDGGDQGFLNEFFSEWWALPSAHRLPMLYNTHHFVFQFISHHETLRKTVLPEIKIVHYTLQKPWLAPTVTGGAELWWHFYERLHPEAQRRWRTRVHQLEDWAFEKVLAAVGA